jgi:hypothetical protein
MRKTNWRLVTVGVILLDFAVVFFLEVLDMTPRANGPGELMRRVGQVAGAVGGISIVIIIFGLVGKKSPT